MRTLRIAIALAAPFVLGAPGCVLAGKSAAKSEPAATADQTAGCRGTNMLPELAASDPETFARIDSEAKAAENGNAIFWKIEKPGVEPSYVFGTVHLTDPRVTTLSSKVLDALGKSKAVLLEAADNTPAATASALAQAAKTTLFSDGRSLEKLLSPADYEKVRSTVDRSGLPPGMARLYKPWIVTLLISASGCERQKIQNGDLVLDMKIAEEAKSRGIPVTGLETLVSQLEAMSTVPEDQQLDMLRATLASVDRTDDLVETMVQLYLDRRIGGLWPFQLALAAKAGVGENSFAFFRQALIVERNEKMRDGALPFIEKGGAFIAVGALHLPGRTGLISLFSAKGYTVTPVE